MELYHAEHITLPLKLGSYEELRYTHRVIDVDMLPRLVDSRFHPHLRLLWIEGYDLLQEEPVWVPHELVHTDYTLPLPPGCGCFLMTSTGLASGNHLLEAVSHGICEVVERDATTLWTMRDEEAQHRTRVDLDTVDDPDCRALLAQYERANVNVAVWDTTTDVGMPSFLGSIIERTDDPLRLLYLSSGMGCHPARHIALLRALTEAAQSRLTYIAGSRDDAMRSRYEQARDADVLRQCRAQMEIKGPMRHFQDIPTWEGETFQADVTWELDRLRAAGMTRCVVVNLMRREFRLPVVRVIIPGLEGPDHAAGYTPGRRARALTESYT